MRVDPHAGRDAAVLPDRQPAPAVEDRERPNPGPFADADVAEHEAAIVDARAIPEAQEGGALTAIEDLLVERERALPARSDLVAEPTMETPERIEALDLLLPFIL